MNKEWAENYKNMISLLKKNTLSEGLEALIDLRNTLMEEVLSWKCLPQEYFYAMPYMNVEGYHSKSVAYSLWHIFRIEDIVVNSLIKKEKEILFVDSYNKKMNASIITTGNELKKSEIEEFSKRLNIDVLYQYIDVVKNSTEDWLKTLNYADLKVCYTDDDKLILKALGVVSNEDSAEWLINYWCSKDIKGLIKMPLSRHWIMHIEASLRILKKLKKI